MAGRPAATRREARRILVVADETAASRSLTAAIRGRVDGAGCEVFIVCPSTSIDDAPSRRAAERARRDAHARLDASLEVLAGLGIVSDGIVGDPDPVQAVNGALASFTADEIVVSTHPPGRSRWLASGLVERLRAEQHLPVVHVTVDLASERAGNGCGSPPGYLRSLLRRVSAPISPER